MGADKIKELQDKANAPDVEASKIRWETAKQIWLTLQEQSFRALSDELRSIRSKQYSLAYLQRMNKCWDKVGRVLYATGGYKALPPFTEVYNSDQIRQSDNPRQTVSESDTKQESGRQRTNNPRRSDSDQGEKRESASDWVQTVSEIVSRLANFPSFWPLLSPQDAAKLRAMIPKIRTIAAGIERPKG